MHKLPPAPNDAPLHHQLADGYLQKLDDIVKVKADEESDKVLAFAVWKNGHWQRFTTDYIEQGLQRLLLKMSPKTARPAPVVKNAYDLIVSHIQTTYEMDWDRSLNSIPLKNRERSLCLHTGNIIDTPKADQMIRHLEVPENEIGNKSDFQQSKFKGMLETWLDDPDRRNFTQQALAQGLMGNPMSTIMDCWGTGRNGKGALFDFLRKAVGQFCISLDTKYFLQGQSKHESDKVKLKHGRFAIVGEFEAGARIDTGELKGLAAGDPLSASKKGKDGFEITSQCLFIVHGNAILQIQDKSLGIRDRWKTLKFLHYIKPEDRMTKDAMASIAEREKGIFLWWLIEGIRQFRQNGNCYKDISQVLEDTKNFFVGNNVIDQLLAEFCIEIPNHGEFIGDIFTEVEKNHEYHWRSVRKLTTDLEENGLNISRQNKNKKPMLMGWMLKKSAEVCGFATEDVFGNWHLTGAADDPDAPSPQDKKVLDMKKLIKEQKKAV